MPTLLDRIGETMMGYLTPKERNERGAPPTMEVLTSLMGGGIPPSPKAGEGMKIYQENPWVYAAVNAIMSELSETDILLRRLMRTKDGVEYEQIHEHQSLDLMRVPIPNAGGRSHMNGGQHMEITWIHNICSGEAAWYISQRVSGIPSEMHILRPDKLEVKLDNENLIDHYTYRNGAEQFRYDPEDVIHFKRSNPRNLYRGQSSFLASGVAIDTDAESDKFLWNFFKNRAVPDAILTRKEMPSKEEVSRFKEIWNSLYRGGENAGKIGMLWGGTEITELTKDQSKMQFKEMKEFNRDAIMASQRVGKGIIGMMEDQSRANAEAQEYVFAKRVIRPLLKQFTRQLTADYLSQFGNVEGLEFYFEDPVTEDEISKSGVCKALFDMGAVSINEVREKFGYDARDEEEADALWGSISRQPIGTEEEPEPEGEEPPDTDIDDDEERSLLERANDDEFSDLLKKYGSIDNVPMSALDAAEAKRVRDMGMVIADGVVLESAKEIAEFSKATEGVVGEAFGIGIDLGHETLTDPAFTAEAIANLATSREALQSFNLKMAERTLKATKIDLMRIMDKGIIEGLSNAAIGKLLSKRYGETYKGYRSERIARTETTGIINAGAGETLLREGVKTKTWIDTSDGRTRESHRAVADRTADVPISISNRFDVGGYKADYPGDSSLPAHERINCRCTVVSGDLDASRGKQFGNMFLRAEGSIEQKFTKVLIRAFEAQRKRLLQHF
tara:strand:+ start:2862 stop:5051 length:2190 start_codon:yes stop_codon:yes gene_type:complete